jgi:hypothetical protein
MSDTVAGMEPFGVFDQTPVARYLADVIDIAVYRYMQTVETSIARHRASGTEHRTAMGTAVATFRRWKPEHENEAADSVQTFGSRCPAYATATMRRMAAVLRAAGTPVVEATDTRSVYFPRLVRHVYTSLAVDPYILAPAYFAETPDAYFARRTVHRRALLHAMEMGCHDPGCWTPRRAPSRASSPGSRRAPSRASSPGSRRAPSRASSPGLGQESTRSSRPWSPERYVVRGDGHAADGHAADGHAADGHGADGHAADGVGGGSDSDSISPDDSISQVHRD